MPLRKDRPESREQEDEKREKKELKRLRKPYAKGINTSSGRPFAIGFLIGEDAADDEPSQSDGISDPSSCNLGSPQQGTGARMGGAWLRVVERPVPSRRRAQRQGGGCRNAQRKQRRGSKRRRDS